MTTPEFIQRGCRENPFVRLPGFHVSMGAFDYLHVVDLTLIPDSVASALLELTAASEGENFFSGGDQDARLRSAYVQFSDLCKSHRVSYLA